MRRNAILMTINICIFLVFCISCPETPETSVDKVVIFPEPAFFPEPESNTSWDQLNQVIQRSNNWTRIVENTDLFQLSNESTFSHNQTFRNFSDDYYIGYYGTFPAIDGSTVLLPLAAEIGWQFLDLSDNNINQVNNTRQFLNFSTTHYAFCKLIGAANYSSLYSPRHNYTYGSIYYVSQKRQLQFDIHRFYKQPDIIFVTSPSADELKLAAEYGVELTIEPICYDSFVFITHIDNLVNNLKSEQIRDIYSGKITNWNEVGGADEKIVAYQREGGSGSQTTMEEIVMNGIPLMDAPVNRFSGMGELVEWIAAYSNAPNAIGYTFKYYVDRLYINQNIKILSVDGVEPNDDNVRNNIYPFTAPYNAVIRSIDADDVGGKFLDWLLSEEGQSVIAQAGFVTRFSQGQPSHNER
jgi:phosphate transport system substrate-binding protein